MKENRAMERFNLSLPVYVSVFDEGEQSPSMDLWTTNICAGGTYLQTKKPLPLETKVKIDVILPFATKPEGGRRIIHITGSVIRVEDSGMAVAFDKNYNMCTVPAEQLGAK